jgi:hypothetical protein
MSDVLLGALLKLVRFAISCEWHDYNTSQGFELTLSQDEIWPHLAEIVHICCSHAPLRTLDEARVLSCKLRYPPIIHGRTYESRVKLDEMAEAVLTTVYILRIPPSFRLPPVT